MTEIMNEVYKYITRDGQYGIEMDDNLFEKGFLDSMGVLELISLIEEYSKKEFDPELFVVGNFMTLNAIKDFIATEIHD